MKSEKKKKKDHPKKNITEHVLPRLKNTPPKKLVFLGSLILIPVTMLLVFELYFWNRVIPGVYLHEVQLSGKTYDEARSVIDTVLAARSDAAVIFHIDEEEVFRLDGTDHLVGYDVSKTAETALMVGRSGSPLEMLRERYLSLFYGTRLKPTLAYDHDTVYRALDKHLRPIENRAVEATFTLVNNDVTIQGGTSGEEVDMPRLMGELGHFWAFTSNTNRIELTFSHTSPVVQREDLESLEEAVRQLISRTYTLVTRELFAQQFSISGVELFSLLSYEKVDGKMELRLDEYKVAERFKTLADAVRRNPTDARFQLTDGRASVFQPSADGTALDTRRLSVFLLTAALDPQASTTIEVPLQRTPPAITTASVNDYGIQELVGTGRSSFRGSSAGRVHNVALGSQKLNGVLIAPDEVFSMYKVVGEIEKETGFKDAFVIKNGRTIPGVGGGVCQVSTTLFRAVLDAGLPVLERRPHSYRVSYYEQDAAPGIDAAVYFPSWDLKFKNDTGNYLLLETKVDTKTMKAEYNLYGVRDGREVTMTKPVVSGQTPPPPDLYIDDPNLERGKTVQDEHAAWGAQVSFTRTVTRNGEVLSQDVFKSAYKPWQAVFRVGTRDI